MFEGSKDHRSKPNKNRFAWSDGDIKFVDSPGKKLSKPVLKLTTEGGLERKHPSAGFILRILSELDTGNGNSFCCLESSDGSYVQALHGLNGWHLEWRECAVRRPRAYRHYRAANILGMERKRLLRKSDKFVSRGLECDLLNAEDVQQLFSAFLRTGVRPKSFRWRRLKI